ncbi:MAG: STAS domain-containing protein [Fuerstiella sp.]|jgi:anti-anti-sigma factor|nr:STAS domain-containing protein [Fuerstiella sp.]
MWEKSRHGAIDVISGTEPLTLETCDSLRRLLEDCVNDGQPQLVLDFQQIPLIDSAGLELLLDIRESCVRRGGQFQLAALNTLCLDILQVTGIASQFELYDDSVAAAGSHVQ